MIYHRVTTGVESAVSGACTERRKLMMTVVQRANAVCPYLKVENPMHKMYLYISCEYQKLPSHRKHHNERKE